VALEQTPAKPPRRRRRPEDARREILDAAESLLREQPFHTLRVDALMRRTTLSRKSFYVYFPDRFALLVGLFEPLGERFAQAHGVFLEGGSGDLLEDGRTAMEAVAGLFMQGGWLLRALADARDYDDDARRLWNEIHEPLYDMFAQKIAEEIEAGRIRPLDPELTARALLTMDIRLFLDTLAEDPEADLVALTPGLLTIWARTLLLRDP
jgi:AcrR family transcriptional regulator